MPSNPITLKITGAAEMRREIERIANRVPDAVVQALRGTAEEILTEAKQKYVPVDLGTLRSSGHVQPVKRTDDILSVTLVFGGAAAPYALSVHEHPSSASPPSWRGKRIEDIKSVRSRTPWNVGEGRGPKYLERPLKRAVRSGSFADRIVRKIREATK